MRKKQTDSPYKRGYSSKLNSTVHIHEATINSADLEAKPAAASAGRRHSLVHGGSQKLNRLWSWQKMPSM
ncbi:hypothetical protein L3X38_041804 [Prunus dulcis]|uniref:Uncharacterized protein n=1 Tax=Prunus dulcis TaxID=3755 RepID=A0AAD4UVE6_PRUDU|nr:hypothetical protein L3X38_041804 [Prunus dulcis]